MKFVLIKFSCLIWFVQSMKSFCECNKKNVQWFVNNNMKVYQKII